MNFTHVHNEKTASNVEVALVFAYLLSERYEDSLCQESCMLKNETVLCKNQGDRLCHFCLDANARKRCITVHIEHRCIFYHDQSPCFTRYNIHALCLYHDPMP